MHFLCLNYIHRSTVEPPNKGHFGSASFVLYSEAVLWWEVQNHYRKHHNNFNRCHSGCPLVGGSIIGGSTVFTSPPPISLSLSLSDGTPKRSAKLVRILRPEVDSDFEVGPALFGPDIGENEFQVSAELVEPKPDDGCSTYYVDDNDSDDNDLTGKIFLVTRGNCLFVQKVSLKGVTICSLEGNLY